MCKFCATIKKKQTKSKQKQKKMKSNKKLMKTKKRNKYKVKFWQINEVFFF